VVASYSGVNVSPLFATGNQGSFSSNGYVEFPDLAPFNMVVLASAASAFEIDNISAGFVSHQLPSPIGGTLTVSDPVIGDTLTASVIGNAVVTYDGSTTLPADANVSELINAAAITLPEFNGSGRRPTNLPILASKFAQNQGEWAAISHPVKISGWRGITGYSSSTKKRLSPG
jgi:fibronectin-binding autotransporter adhesin